MAADPRETAFAKVNLTLHVTGRRADGYHLLDSLVAFAGIGDVVSLDGTAPLTISGPFAAGLHDGADNLVLRAARLYGADLPPLTLEKNLPIAAGLGGGSADAAATLRLLARVLDRPVPLAQLAGLGADVPVCLNPVPQRMTGAGEILHPAYLPEFWLVLVNSGQPVRTANIFAALTTTDNPGMDWDGSGWTDLVEFADFLRRQRNDLEAAATMAAPALGDVLAALAAQPRCQLARMSGSGASCFGLFGRQLDAERAAGRIEKLEPGWWVRAAPRV